MYHCMAFKTNYEDENLARKCCTQFTFGEDMDDVRSPRKLGKFMGGSHCCPEVKVEGRSWSTFIKAEESCPVCGWIDMSR